MVVNISLSEGNLNQSNKPGAEADDYFGDFCYCIHPVLAHSEMLATL